MRPSRLRISVLATSVLAAFSGHAFAARVDYTVDLGMERNSNVTMAPSDPIEQRYLRAGLGFSITENVSALQLNLDGRAEYRDYEDDIFADTVDGTLSGRMNWVAIPDRLFVVVEDNLTVQPVNSLVPDGPGNRQQVNVFSAGPTMLFNWSPQLHGQAELRYVNSDAEVTDEFNSQRLAAAVRTIRELTPTSRVSLNLQAQRVDFDDDIVARDYNRYDLYGRYVRELANFQLGADLGYSRIDYRQGESRSEPLLRADVEWTLSPHSQMTAVVSSQFSDTATDALAGIQSESTVPVNVLTGDAVVNASPYEVRSLDLGYSYTGTRLNLSLTPYVQKRDYVDSDTFDQKTRGTRFDLHWLMRRGLSLGSYATWERLDYTQLGREDETTRIGASLEYQWVRRWSVRLHAERYKRESTDINQDVAQNIVYLSVAYSNR
ncbi:MAG TPA: outer membrane beta-barrel protein [Pseudoxanthomonas sp.]